MSDAIVIDRLTKHYGRRRVVDLVNLRIPTGCVYGFLGRNGAGKSTLIKMLLGMVQPDAGHATLLGEDIANSARNSARIAYLAEGHPLYRWMTVGEAVRFTRRFYTTWHDQFLERILDHFRILAQAKDRPAFQRPTGPSVVGLGAGPRSRTVDSRRSHAWSRYRRAPRVSGIDDSSDPRSGRTILFSSHILNDVERVADRIGIIIDGVLRVDCPTDHFKSSLRRVALEFTGSVPELPPLPGLVSQRQYGGKLELVIVGYGDTQAAILESLGASSMEVVEMNLEDAFVAYTRDPAPAAADIRTGACLMLKALAWKELRELLPVVAVVALLQAFQISVATGIQLGFMSEAIRNYIHSIDSIPFVSDQLCVWISTISAAAAVAVGIVANHLGIRTRNISVPVAPAGAARSDYRNQTASRRLIVLGVGDYARVLCYALWASTPGTHASPFFWSMTAGPWQFCTIVPLIYLGAFFSGLRHCELVCKPVFAAVRGDPHRQSAGGGGKRRCRRSLIVGWLILLVGTLAAAQFSSSEFFGNLQQATFLDSLGAFMKPSCNNAIRKLAVAGILGSGALAVWMFVSGLAVSIAVQRRQPEISESLGVTKKGRGDCFRNITGTETSIPTARSTASRSPIPRKPRGTTAPGLYPGASIHKPLTLSWQERIVGFSNSNAPPNLWYLVHDGKPAGQRLFRRIQQRFEADSPVTSASMAFAWNFHRRRSNFPSPATPLDTMVHLPDTSNQPVNRFIFECPTAGSPTFALTESCTWWI